MVVLIPRCGLLLVLYVLTRWVRDAFLKICQSAFRTIARLKPWAHGEIFAMAAGCTGQDRRIWRSNRSGLRWLFTGFCLSNVSCGDNFYLLHGRLGNHGHQPG